MCTSLFFLPALLIGQGFDQVFVCSFLCSAVLFASKQLTALFLQFAVAAPVICCPTHFF